MTNKKLKLAAMSVALTACVAAQPLVAHAVDAPADPEGKDADPKAALEEGADLKGQEENAPEGKDQVEAPVNKEAPKEDQEPAFAPDTESKDVEIDYKDPQPDPKDPDTTITEGDVIDTSKKDEETGETGKIGKATKTETVDPDASTTEVEMGKTTTHPDGSTTPRVPRPPPTRAPARQRLRLRPRPRRPAISKRTRRRARSTWTRSWARTARS